MVSKALHHQRSEKIQCGKTAKDSKVVFHLISNSIDNFYNFCNSCENTFLCNFNINKGDSGTSNVACGASRLSAGAKLTDISAVVSDRDQTAKANEGILKFIYTNATSLNNKTQELTARLNTSDKPKVVMVAESWFNENSTPFISGYNLYRKDRVGRGGGVCIYVCKSVVSAEVCNPNLYATDLEVTWCELRSGSERILAGCFYRKPGASVGVGRELCRIIREAKKAVEIKNTRP